MDDRIQITEAFKQSVRDAIDIVDLASDVTKVEKRGNRYVGLCPFHKEKSPSFSVDAEQGLYYCFGCGAGGDAIRFYMETSGESFVEALETLAQRYGVPIPRTSEPHRSESGVEAALQAAQEFFTDRLKSSRIALHYLEQRRIAPELVSEFGLGFAPDEWRELTSALSRRFPIEVLMQAGLVGRSEKSERPYDRFRNRLVFPIHTASGRLVGFGGRTLGEDRAKYINSAETAAFQKKHLLYNLHRARKAIRGSNHILLVEGYFDVIGAVASGVEWAVASMGTSLTKQQVSLLGRYSKEIVLGFDGDRAGEAACRKALPLLLSSGLSVRRAQFPAGQDPDSVRLEAGPKAVERLVAESTDAIELLISRLSPNLRRQPRLQARAAERLRDLLGPVDDNVLRYAYVRQAAERIGVPADVLWEGMEKARERSTRQKTDSVEEPPPTENRRKARTVLSIEEEVLQILLAPDEETGAYLLPPADTLVEAQVFLDPDCRLIYETYLEVRKSNTDEDLRVATEVRRRLQQGDAGARAIDRLAPLLLQKTLRPNENELADRLRKLERRWQQQRIKYLALALEKAQRDGDQEKLRDLLEEKATLSKSVYGLPNR